MAEGVGTRLRRFSHDFKAEGALPNRGSALSSASTTPKQSKDVLNWQSEQ